MSNERVQTPSEELANAVTHGLGATLGAVGLVLLVVYTSFTGDPWAIVATAIYGASVVVLFGASATYHWVESSRPKRIFQVIDHAAIFFLIAGTYTPFTLVTLRGPWGWSLFGVVWGIAAIGVVFETVWLGLYPRLSIGLYLAMGWVGLVAAVPFWNALPGAVIAWLAAGGIAYTLGVVFFAWEKLPFHHTYWHLFVLAGAACHFAAVWGAVL
ncbi:MAG: hemolysin III family protein [Deltaproteobacteria bacterium]|nr:hemolysin III family protein [Deltaproteobacteria bacterium]